MGVKAASFVMGAICGSVILVAAVAFFLPPPGGGPEVEIVADSAQSPAAPAGPSRRIDLNNPDFSFVAPNTWKRMSAAELQDSKEQLINQSAVDLRYGLFRGPTMDEADGLVIFATLGLRDGAPELALSNLVGLFTAASWFDWLWGGDLDVVSPSRTFEIEGYPAADFIMRMNKGPLSPSLMRVTVIDLSFDRLIVVSGGSEKSPAAAEAAAILATFSTN